MIYRTLNEIYNNPSIDKFYEYEGNIAFEECLIMGALNHYECNAVIVNIEQLKKWRGDPPCKHIPPFFFCSKKGDRSLSDPRTVTYLPDENMKENCFKFTIIDECEKSK